MEKIELTKAARDKLIENADKLAFEAATKYLSCAPGTFHGICEAFRNEGIELMPLEMQKGIFMGMQGLHGGTAMTGVGTCGGASAACFLISYVAGVTEEDLGRDPSLDVAACMPGAIYVIDRFEEAYGAFDCLRLRYNRVQRAVDFLDPDSRFWELLFAVSQKEKCGAFSERDFHEMDHPVIKAAMWGAEGICDLLQMDPEKRKEIPDDMHYPDTEQIEKKIAPLLTEFGYPTKKISYRHLRRERLGEYKRDV